MRTGIVIQARMSSKRYPGKVLHDVAGKPMLKYTLERLARCDFENQLVLATSVEPTDDALAQYCAQQGVACFRGALDDVAGRFVGVIDQYALDGFVRVNGDSPLLDVELVEGAVRAYASGSYDLVTNVMPRTFPFGQSVEVVRAAAFLEAYAHMQSPEEREHVTKRFYTHHAAYRILNITCDAGYEGLRFCVDDVADMELFSRVVARMDRHQADYKLAELVALYREEAIALEREQ